ncbi:MAG TPA: glycosyltransferase [Pyrinomonadaceae bacterium]|nr:glycosyltransferase [Pyrinomonadaceae bacterium]
MIPRTIHYCWFGRGPLSDLNRRCLESWRRVMPDFRLKEWNETNTPLEDDYSRAAYAAGSWSRLSNLVRLRALLTEGGIYLDTDVEVLRDFAPLLGHECFLGFQQREEEEDWVNGAVLGARPGHPFLERCVELTTELFARTGKFYRGPTVVTRALKEAGLEEYGRQELRGVTLYPAEYFYPFPWFGRFTPGCVTDKTFCVHHWEGSWKKTGLERFLSPLRILKRRARALIPKV